MSAVARRHYIRGHWYLQCSSYVRVSSCIWLSAIHMLPLFWLLTNFICLQSSIQHFWGSRVSNHYYFHNRYSCVFMNIQTWTGIFLGIFFIGLPPCTRAGGHLRLTSNNTGGEWSHRLVIFGNFTSWFFLTCFLIKQKRLKTCNTLLSLNSKSNIKHETVKNRKNVKNVNL